MLWAFTDKTYRSIASPKDMHYAIEHAQFIYIFIYFPSHVTHVVVVTAVIFVAYGPSSAIMFGAPLL